MNFVLLTRGRRFWVLKWQFYFRKTPVALGMLLSKVTLYERSVNDGDGREDWIEESLSGLFVGTQAVRRYHAWHDRLGPATSKLQHLLVFWESLQALFKHNQADYVKQARSTMTMPASAIAP